MNDLKLIIRDMPPGLNKIKKMHWTMYRKDRDLWRLIVRQAIGRNMRCFSGRVIVEYTAYRVQLMDKDNHHGSFKLIGDALVFYGIIKDDGPEVIDEDLSTYRQERVHHRYEQHIEITVKDLENIVCTTKL